MHVFHNGLPFLSFLPFLPERMKIEKVEKLVNNLHDKTEYVIDIRNLKQALIRGLDLKKAHKLIKINQKAWLKTYIEMNTNLRRKAKNNFQRDFFKLMNSGHPYTGDIGGDI